MEHRSSFSASHFNQRTERRKSPESDALTSSDEERDFAGPIKRVSSQPWGGEIQSFGRSQARSSFDSLGLDRQSIWGMPMHLVDVPEDSVTEDPTKIPFPYPLQPVRKSTRSQSYSVGQLERSALDGTNPDPNSSPFSQRPFIFPRTSNPRLNESAASGRLGSVFEQENEHVLGDVIEGLGQGPWNNSSNSTNNGVLKNSSVDIKPAPESPWASSLFNQASRRSDTPESSDTHFSHDFSPAQHIGLSGNNIPFSSSSSSTTFPSRSIWRTTLPNMGVSVPEPPQSRRHSLAEVPVSHLQRSNSTTTRSMLKDEILSSAIMDDPNQAIHDDLNYFGNGNQPPPVTNDTERSFENIGAQPSPATPLRSPTNSRLLYAVAFKCDRTEIYQIPMSVGLRPQVGDLVIVDGDRGHDLGTVINAEISVEEAKSIKERATEAHIRWLLMFSRKFAGANQIRAPQGMIPGAVGDNVDDAAHKIIQKRAEVLGCKISELDIRPKMIRRLALVHEVQSLQMKEGMEAKARRACQTQVDQLGKRMEILDAEFQADYRKLTFYYYADRYIDFNSLVQCLFRTFKTRIWMSAINPDSFAIMAEQKEQRKFAAERERIERESMKLHENSNYATQGYSSGSSMVPDKDIIGWNAAPADFQQGAFASSNHPSSHGSMIQNSSLPPPPQPSQYPPHFSSAMSTTSYSPSPHIPATSGALDPMAYNSMNNTGFFMNPTATPWNNGFSVGPNVMGTGNFPGVPQGMQGRPMIPPPVSQSMDSSASHSMNEDFIPGSKLSHPQAFGHTQANGRVNGVKAVGSNFPRSNGLKYTGVQPDSNMNFITGQFRGLGINQA